MHKIIQTVFAGPYYIKKDYKNVSRIKKLQKKKKKGKKEKKIRPEEGFLILIDRYNFLVKSTS